MTIAEVMHLMAAEHIPLSAVFSYDTGLGAALKWPAKQTA